MRKNKVQQAFRDLRGRLKEIGDDQELSLAEHFNATMAAIAEFLKGLEERVSEGFADKFEEIFFYKFEKPEYEALRLYHIDLFQLLRKKPSGPAEVLRAFFLEELAAISRKLKQHDFLYDYFRSGFTELDEALFIRREVVSFVLLGAVPVCDCRVTTPGSELFALFTAQESLQAYLIGELKKLDEVSGAAPVKRKWFDWTGELINLVELGYGIFLSRQVKAGLQEIFNWLEESFGVEIGIPANRFREIKRRKRLSRTQYTELMQRSLIDYMEQDNE